MCSLGAYLGKGRVRSNEGHFAVSIRHIVNVSVNDRPSSRL